jgi:hypothetical protein
MDLKSVWYVSHGWTYEEGRSLRMGNNHFGQLGRGTTTLGPTRTTIHTRVISLDELIVTQISMWQMAYGCPHRQREDIYLVSINIIL